MKTPWWRKDVKSSMYWVIDGSKKKPTTRNNSLQLDPNICLNCKKREAHRNYTGPRYINESKFWRTWYKKELVHCPRFRCYTTSVNNHPRQYIISFICHRRKEHAEFSKPLLEWPEIKTLVGDDNEEESEEKSKEEGEENSATNTRENTDT